MVSYRSWVTLHEICTVTGKAQFWLTEENLRGYVEEETWEQRQASGWGHTSKEPKEKKKGLMKNALSFCCGVTSVNSRSPHETFRIIYFIYGTLESDH